MATPATSAPRPKARPRRAPSSTALAPASPAQAAAPIRHGLEWGLPVAAIALVGIMMIPIPALALDVLLTISIALAMVVLLVAIQILRPVQFSVFPSLLLLMTLFRLALNLASTRRILLHGSEGVAAAGHVIEAFGQFVVGGNYVVGFVVFLALIAIQFLVVSHGAVRTAEVTARFTLDALPGKQMAIDADLNAGMINESQARERRQGIAREAEFYGAMDGAARFTQRDAMATILITAINIFAGFAIGVFQQHMALADALRTYTILTVGDGLVTLIPSLLVSVAGAIVVTRASSEETLGADLGAQLLARPRALWIAAGALVGLALMPGMPKFSFFLLAGLLATVAQRLTQKQKQHPDAKPAATPGTALATPEQLEPLLKIEPLALEVGYALVPLVDEAQGGKLLTRIRALRKQLAMQLGFIVPSIHITDNLQLQPREYVLSLRGVEIGRYETHLNHLLAIHSGLNAPSIDGKETREPAFGVAARWIAPQQQDQALADGFAVVDQTAVMATHIAELIRQNAHELLTRQETQRLLDSLSESQPKLVEELVPKLLSLGELQRILQQLLREHVSIRDLPTILEALIETAAVRKNPVALVESARQALGRALVQPLLASDGSLRVITLSPPLEEELARSFDAQAAQPPPPGSQGGVMKRVLEGLRRFAYDPASGAPQVLLCSSPGRFYLRRMLEASWPRLNVLSPGEIPPKTTVQSLGTVS